MLLARNGLYNTQLYNHCHRHETATTVGHLERCLVDVSYWISANCLKLNSKNMELLWAGSEFSLSWFDSSGLSLHIHSNIVKASDHVRVLSITFSSDLSLNMPRHQRSTLCRRAFSVAGPIVWNLHPDELRDDIEDSCFRQSLKTQLFSQY